MSFDAIKRRIKTAEDLLGVVKTMKALAAVNIRHFEEATKSLAEYNRAVSLGFQILMRNRPQGMSPGKEVSSAKVGAVVFGSDQGMCGQLNELIVTHALETLVSDGASTQNRAIIAVGHRVAERLTDAGQPVLMSMRVPVSPDGIIPKAHEIIIELERWHSRERIHRVVLFYSQYLGGASYLQHTAHLLPVDERWLGGFRTARWPTRVLPAFTMDWQRLFQVLIRQHLFVSLYRAFAESLASEHASRLASMQSAEKNIRERIEELNALYHRQRQTTITEEILDLVSGFTALTDDEDR